MVQDWHLVLRCVVKPSYIMCSLSDRCDFVCLSVYLSVYLPVCLHVSIYLSIYLSVYLSVYLSICLSSHFCKCNPSSSHYPKAVYLPFYSAVAIYVYQNDL
jgi:hypothetical protein